MDMSKSNGVDPLTILFGSLARVKLLRFFLFNPRQEFTFDDISKRARLVRRTARTEINALERAEVIKKNKLGQIIDLHIDIAGIARFMGDVVSKFEGLGA